MLTALIACLSMTALQAQAEEGTDNDTSAQPTALLDLEVAEPMSSDELNSHRAMAKIEVDRLQINHSDSDGVVVDNVAAYNDTGDNAIMGDAFVDSAGFISSVQNTGNNVLIQNSTIINVSVEP